MEDKIKAGKEEYTIHLVPQFHYDVEYLKTYEDYLPIVFDNLLEAHKILSHYPEYSFLVEQVLLLEVFFKEYPKLLPDFKRFAEEKRLEVSAGFYIMADLNMPSGESLVRQLVYGRKWLKENLGFYPKVFHGGDFAWPSALSIHRVKKWNSLYPQYKVIFSTFKGYFGSIP